MNKIKISKLSFKPRFLVIDDEKRIREGCQKTLELENYEVSVAESGGRGLEILEQDYFDIILLDLMMPGLSGMDVLGQVKDRYPDTVIIVITGYATLEHAIEAMKKGAFDFISKPFSPDELRRVVSKAIYRIQTLDDIANEKSRTLALINHLSAGVLATDAQENIALANPAFLRMMDYRGEPVGKPITDIVGDNKLNELINRATTMPEGEFSELTMELGLEGSHHKETVLVLSVPFRDRLNRNLGAITVLRDITAQKKIDRLKSDFVSMVAHEIRSPMHTVMAQLKVVLDGLAGDVTEKQTEILGRASEKISNLGNLATELLDLAKIESGLTTQEKEKYDLSQLISEQVKFYQATATEKNIQLALNQPEKLPLVLCNRFNMEEVFSNLISNAIKYSPTGGTVKVSADKEGSYICISVCDTGYGIPEDEIDKVFNRFYRVVNDRTRYITGTGLGLAIVKSIVKAHDGMVRVKSKPDRGSTFFVYLPVVDG